MRIKVIAIFLNLLFINHLVAPTYVYALTSGPSSPEFTGFTPAGASELVNLFTGDFSYNIPLMDVGGYPINLAYSAGVTMEEEASWVGLGWNINPGAINRQVRGLPDDFSGDEVKREYALKNNHTFGVKAKMKYEFAGFGDKAQGFEEMMEKLQKASGVLDKYSNTVKPFTKLGYGDAESKVEAIEAYLEAVEAGEALENDYDWADKKKMFYPYMGYSYNNYRGSGLEMGVDIGAMVRSKNDKGSSGSFDFSYGTQNGFGLTMSASSFSAISKEIDCQATRGSKTTNGSISLNSRNGLTAIGFDHERTTKKVDLENNTSGASKTRGGSIDLTFNSPGTAMPDFPMFNFGFSAGFEPGAEGFFAKGQTAFNGYYSGQYQRGHEFDYGGYGYLYLEKHKDQLGKYEKGSEQYLLDYFKEGDKTLSRDVPNLPLPVLSYDVYHASGQGMSMTFRPHRYDNGTVHDPNVRSRGIDASLDIESGVGKDFAWGADIGLIVSNANKGKWETGNITDNFYYKSAAEMGLLSAKPYYFKASSDMSVIDDTYYNSMNTDGLISPTLKNTVGMFINASDELRKGDVETSVSTISSSHTQNTVKPAMQHNIVGLTAAEAARYGLQRQIEYYDADGNKQYTDRTGSAMGYEKRDAHLSEFHITKPDGSEYVYGLPVYNVSEKEVSFSLEHDDTYGCDRIVDYTNFNLDPSSPGQLNGFDNYYNSRQTPAYVSAHLITGILSPDYEDLTGDGISDDDHGSAVKFSYMRQNFGTDNFYQYRTPYAANTAKVNIGLMSDDYDDKASYSYGEKEVYYLKEVESKNFIAKFILNEPTAANPQGHDRNDGIGVDGESGGKDATNQRLRRLERIELYSKEDLAKNPGGATPIKTVHFGYDYSRCKGIPNAEADAEELGGKLTLTSVWFTYGHSTRGSLSSYQFEYSTENPDYDQNASDRWGNYKPEETADCNLLTSYPNERFPYVSQDAGVDTRASAWNLNKIILPSGGAIEVTYEADDYSHVQNQQAMRMFSITNSYYDLAEPGSASANTCRLFEHSSGNKHVYGYLEFDLEEPLYSTQQDANDAVKNLYGNLGTSPEGNALNKVFYQCEVYVNPDKDADLTGRREVISGYADVEAWGALKSNSLNNYFDKGYIKLAEVDLNGSRINGNNDKVHPIAYESWNFFRKYLSKYINQSGNIKTSGISNAADDPISNGMQIFRNLVGEYGQEVNRLFKGINRTLRTLGFAEKIVTGRSMIRLSDPNRTKYGGGHRVKSVRISDNWKSMTGGTHIELDGEYGQDYEYTEYDPVTATYVSSGVAANEPMIGWEECALKQFDELWEQRKPLAANSFAFFERPYGSSFLPGASVGYGTVSVKAHNPLGNQPVGAEQISRTATGKTVHQFFTTRDHPTITRESEIQQRQSRPIVQGAKLVVQQAIEKVKLFKYKNKVLGLAQGYLIKTNDMNGRQKAVNAYGEGATEYDVAGNRVQGINSTTYEYKLGEVSLIAANGDYSTGQNVDLDFVVESTQTRAQTASPQVQLQAEVASPLAMAPPLLSGAYDKNEVRYVVSTKHLHQRATLVAVHTSDRGIKNVASTYRIDPVSGSTVLSGTLNEFNDNLYVMGLPGHWAYSELGSKAVRQDWLLDNITINSNNIVKRNGAAIGSELKNGDKVILRAFPDWNPINRTLNEAPVFWLKEHVFWFLEDKLIDRNGNVLTETDAYKALNINPFNPAYIQIIDPVESNNLVASIGSVSSLNDPPLDGSALRSNVKILSAGAIEYNDRWRTNCCGFQMPFTGYYEYCGDGPCDIVNPYVKGILGKTRPHKSWAVYGNRVSSYSTSTDVSPRADGAIDGFALFWEYDALSGYWQANTSATNWELTSEITEYDENGMELENVNRLDQHTSALFGYDEMLAVATAQNARYGEMAYDGFEDYDYKRLSHLNNYTQVLEANSKCRYDPHFGFENPEEDYFTNLTTDYAHTGLKSLEVDPVALPTGSLSLSYETRDVHSQASLAAPFVMDKGDCFTQFYPVKGESYTLSLWLREATSQPDGYINTEVSIAFFDASQVSLGQTDFLAEGDLIEGWQRVYGHFDIPSNCESFTISYKANGSGSSYFDDVRIYPKDGAMTSYVYHPHTLRLSASLDANNFASFYEYDAEGSLVRVKKETERGIMTLQESRKHIIDNSTP